MFSSTRREFLERIAALAFAGPLAADAAQHVHHAVAEEAANSSGIYRPKALTPREFATLQKLCELIVPGASNGHAAEFIDLLSSQNSEMAAVYTGGLAWLDRATDRAVRANFLTAQPADQKALLDKIAYRHNATLGLAAGVRFFEWARRMTVDAYYTSAAGIQELKYMGNQARTEFKVPPDAIDYALKRSGTA
jgi:hypothetical protein